MRYLEILTEGEVRPDNHAVALAIHAMTDLPIVALMIGKRGSELPPMSW